MIARMNDCLTSKRILKTPVPMIASDYEQFGHPCVTLRPAQSIFSVQYITAVAHFTPTMSHLDASSLSFYHHTPAVT